jgi:hypothetical protein
MLPACPKKYEATYTASDFTQTDNEDFNLIVSHWIWLDGERERSVELRAVAPDMGGGNDR